MSGTLDFEEYVLFCPECGEKQDVLMCEDYDPDEDPSAVIGIAGGSHECTECGYFMTDEDFEEWD